MKMTKNDVQLWAADILVEQGFTIPQIGRAFEEVEKMKHLRQYSRFSYESGKEIVDGCIVARKDEKGNVVFGISAIHPYDEQMIPPKKVTGLIAACKAILAPNSTVPMKFVNLFYTSWGMPQFTDRCFNYFRVDTIRAKIACEKKTGHGYTSRKVTIKKDETLVKSEDCPKRTLKTKTVA